MSAVSAVYQAHDVPVTSRVDYWEHILEDVLVPLRGCHDGAEDFRARLTAGDVGTVRVAESTTPAGACVRTSRLANRSRPDLYEIDVLTSGQVVIEQAGRQAQLQAGDIAFVDPLRPARYVSTLSKHVTVLVPRTMLALHEDDLARLAGVRVAGDRGSGALLSSLARQLPHHLDDYDPVESVRLGTALVDLLDAAMATGLDGDQVLPVGTHQRVLLRQIYAFIDQHLGDPDLSPAGVAAAHHISLRYLHKLFETERATVAGWIRQRRLDRCRRDLLDPGHRARPVGAIAARWGLPNAAHFSRAFKAAYGMPPVEFRAAGDRPTRV